MIAPIATVMAGQPWVPVGITAAVCMALCWTLHRQVQEDVCWPSWFCVFQWSWTTLALSQILGFLSETWPQAEAPKIISIGLLLAALWAAWSGAETCARAGSTLSWLVGLLTLVVFVAALKDMRAENLAPQFRAPNTEIFFILLMPCMAVLLPRRERGGKSTLTICVVLLALTLSVLTTGILPPRLDMSGKNSFYEMSRTLTLSGAVQRFEALISAGLTISWFFLMCMFLSVSGTMVKNMALRWERTGVVLCAVGAVSLYLCDLRISNALMVVGSVLFWGVLPVLAQGIEFRKKM